MRKAFYDALYESMHLDPKIMCLTCDLGFGMLDQIRTIFPNRYFNLGASETAAMAVAVGMAQSHLKPFIYSITPFLLWRPAEVIRLYVNHEKAPVRLIGGGREDNYLHDGYSHFAGDDKDFLKCFPNITAVWPQTNEEIPALIEQMVNEDKPWYANLTR